MRGIMDDSLHTHILFCGPAARPMQRRDNPAGPPAAGRIRSRNVRLETLIGPSQVFVLLLPN